MKKWNCFLVLLFCGAVSNAQYNDNTTSTASGVQAPALGQGFFDKIGTSIYHSAVLYEIKLTDRFNIQLQAQHEQVNALRGISSFPLLAKYYASKKLYVIGGPSVNIDLSRRVPTSLDFKGGLGYDIKKNVFLELQFNSRLSTFNKALDIGSNNTFNVRSGFKF